jgi:hypothetical protein
MERELGRWLIALGGVIVPIGVIVLAGGRLGLGRLPGDLQWTLGSRGTTKTPDVGSPRPS